MEPISSTVTTFLATFRVLREMAKQRKLSDVSGKLQEVYEAFLDVQRQISSLEDENFACGENASNSKTSRISKAS